MRHDQRATLHNLGCTQDAAAGTRKGSTVVFHMHSMTGLLRLLSWLLPACTLLSNSYASPLSPPIDSTSLFVYDGPQTTNSTLNATSLSSSLYPIPDSMIFLSFKFGFPRHWLDPDHLLNLLTVSIQGVIKQVDLYGINTPVPHPPNDPRAFYRSLSFIEVSLSGTDFHDLTYGEVWDILAGLAQYLVGQGKPYRTTFKAATHDTAELGEGFVREIVRGTNGVTQSWELDNSTQLSKGRDVICILAT